MHFRSVIPTGYCNWYSVQYIHTVHAVYTVHTVYSTYSIYSIYSVVAIIIVQYSIVHIYIHAHNNT